MELTYNGGSISNVLRHIGTNEIFVTDTFERAARYANAQTSGTVDPDATELMNGVILEIEPTSEVQWHRRPENHPTLDICEAWLSNFVIKTAYIKFDENTNTLYGYRQYGGYKNREQVIAFLESRDIKVIEL